MKETTWKRARSSAAQLPPLLVILLGAHLLNPVFGLAIAERESFQGLVLDGYVCGGFGLLCAQATLLGLWAALEERGWLARLSPALLLLALAAIAPAVLHGDYVTSRYILLPFLAMLLVTPLRWWGVRLRQPNRPTEETRGPVQFSLLQLQCLMVGVAVMVGINGPKLFGDQYNLTPFDYQLAGFTAAYTLLLAIVVCTDSTSGFKALLIRAAGFVALAALPFYEANFFQSQPNFEQLLQRVLLPLHGAQCVVVLLSLLVLQVSGYELKRLPRRVKRRQPVEAQSVEAASLEPSV